MCQILHCIRVDRYVWLLQLHNKLTVKMRSVYISTLLNAACCRRSITRDRDLVNERNCYEIEVSIGFNYVCN